MHANKKIIGYRSTWAEVNLLNLKNNFKEIKRIVGRKVKVMVTVKADGYGHGIIQVARALKDDGVDFLGVACIDEGIHLRQEGIDLPVLILGLVLKDDIEPLFEYNLTPTVCSYDLAVAINKRAQELNKTLSIHIKIDTGMGRIGVMCKDALGVIKKISKLKALKLEGVFTHFTLADVNKDFTLYQIDVFNELIKNLRRSGIHIPLVHSANSVGLINYKNSHFNMVRPGLVTYGLYPSDEIKINLKPLLSLKTKVVYVKRVPKGYGISYGYTYVTKNNSTIVTLPIGYGDGYPRNLSNLGPALIKGKRFKISGRVCMDQIMVDVGDTPVKVGDEVVLIGSQGKNTITAEEIASLSGTIPYEIVCGLGSRIPRIYI